MAVTIQETNPGGAMGNWYWYNVSHRVGRDALNRPDDVSLVQLLLSYLRPYVKVLQDPSLKLLKVDGIYGPITESYIEAYQSHLRAGDPAYHPDGVLDPGTKYQINFASAKRGKMICILNWELHEKAPAAHEGIPTGLHTPPVLKTALKRVI